MMKIAPSLYKKSLQLMAACAVLLSASLLTTVAGINLAVLLLLLLSPIAWVGFDWKNQLGSDEKLFFSLIISICVWDVITNIIAGHTLGKSLVAMIHDMRTFGFIVVLWAVFTNVRVSRVALQSLIIAVVGLASANLLLTVVGVIPRGQYFWPTAPHLYGQVLVGLFFVLAQMWLVRPTRAWRFAVPMLLLLSSLLFASERRTGYVLLAAGLCVWGLLNHRRVFIGYYRWGLVFGVFLVCMLAVSSNIVQQRTIQAASEVSQYLSMSTQERAGISTSLGIRMQFYSSAARLISESNWLIGVGSLDFPSLFAAVNHQQGTTAQQAATQFSNFENPHNEYLFMLATKGVIGLALYLAIFAQACRLACLKSDEVQRVGMLVMIFLFLLSITTNSMMTDMEEGHFTMLMLLVFLAPRYLTKNGDECPTK